MLRSGAPKPVSYGVVDEGFYSRLEANHGPVKADQGPEGLIVETAGSRTVLPSTVEAKLVAPAFDIVPVTPEKQSFGPESTRWTWTVLSNRPGKQVAVLSLRLVWLSPDGAPTTQTWEDQVTLDVSKPWLTRSELSLGGALAGLAASIISLPWLTLWVQTRLRRVPSEAEAGKQQNVPHPPAQTSEQAPVRTVLFTDIEAHTKMMQRLGDAKGRAVLREHERLTREALKAHGGAEVKTMGDGFLASFGSAQKALECAIALQKAFALRQAQGDPQGSVEPISVRVGINAGEPIAEDDDLFGHSVIAAARIAAQAKGGEIVVADVVRQLVAGKGFLFADRGETELRGFDDPVRLFELRWQQEEPPSL